MTAPILLVTTLDVEEGKLKEYKDAVRKAVAFMKENEPQLIAMHGFLDDEAMVGHGFQIHPDSDSIETHFRIIGPFMRNTLQHSKTARVDVYGNLSERALGLLAQVAAASGATLTVKPHLEGFSRFDGGGSASHENDVEHGALRSGPP